MNECVCVCEGGSIGLVFSVSGFYRDFIKFHVVVSASQTQMFSFCGVQGSEISSSGFASCGVTIRERGLLRVTWRLGRRRK